MAVQPRLGVSPVEVTRQSEGLQRREACQPTNDPVRSVEQGCLRVLGDSDPPVDPAYLVGPDRPFPATGGRSTPGFARRFRGASSFCHDE